MMVAREIVESRMTEGDLANPRRSYRVFRVWDDAETTLSPQSALGASGIPVRGETFPNFPEMLADRVRSRRVQNMTNMIEIEWEYVPEGEFYPGPGPGQDGYVVINASSVVRFVDVWRVNPPFPGAIIDGTGNVIPAQLFTDIGGTPVDTNGDPITEPRPFTTYEVLEHRSGPIDKAVFANFVGQRNFTTFDQIEANAGLYVGTTTTAIGPNMFALVHEMHIDGFFHLVQVPKVDQNGRPLTVDVPASGTPPATRASVVVWRQPYQFLFNFQDLSPHFTGF